MTKRKRWAGRRKWARLISILTTLAENGTSERTKLVAAERLTDVMLVREQRELAEIRRTEKAEKESNQTIQTDQNSPDETETAQEAAERFLAGIRARREQQAAEEAAGAETAAHE